MEDNAATTTVLGTINGVLVGGNTADVQASIHGHGAFHLDGATQYAKVNLVPELMRDDEISHLWTKYAGNPVLSDPEHSVTFGTLVANPSGGWYYFAVYQESVSRWESTDLISWSNRTEVFAHGTPGAEGGWDSVIHACNVFRQPGGTWMMLYRAVNPDIDAPFRPGLATSADGTSWTRWDNGGVDDGLWDKLGGNYDPFGTMLVGSTYYIYCNGNPDHGVTHLYTTDDFVTVTAYAGNPIFDNAYCPALLKVGSDYYIFIPRDLGTSGMNPHEHGIAAYRCSDPTFDPDLREYLGYVAINDQAYDVRYLDLPTIPTVDATRTYPAGFGDTLYMLYSGNLTLISLNMLTTSLSGLASLPTIPESRTELYYKTKRSFVINAQFDTMTNSDVVFNVSASLTDSSPVQHINVVDNNLRIYLAGGIRSTSLSLAANVPYQIVIVDDLGTTYVYINNVLVGTFVMENSSTDANWLFIGNGEGNQPIDGYVWDVRIYEGIALTQTQVTNLYATGRIE